MSVKKTKTQPAVVVMRQQPPDLRAELRKYIAQLAREKKRNLAAAKSDRRAGALILRRGGNNAAVLDEMLCAEFGEGRADALHEVALELQRLVKEP